MQIRVLMHQAGINGGRIDDIEHEIMAKGKRSSTAEEKAAKKLRRTEYMTIFIHGKQKRVRRPPTIDGLDVDEFIRINADPVWLHENEMWEYLDLPERPESDDADPKRVRRESADGAPPLEDDDDLPF